MPTDYPDPQCQYKLDFPRPFIILAFLVMYEDLISAVRLRTTAFLDHNSEEWDAASISVLCNMSQASHQVLRFLEADVLLPSLLERDC